MADLLARAASERGGMAMLVGEPGIGKSTLAGAVADLASREGFTVAWGRCRESVIAPPYWPWTQVLRALDVSASPASHTDAVNRFALFETMTATLRLAAHDNPLLIVLDDIHRADEASLRLLGFAVDQLWPSALALIATYRDAEVEGACAEVIAEVAATRNCAQIELPGLSEADIAAWLAEADVDAGFPEADVIDRAATPAEVLAQTGGNPFFIAEVLRLRRLGVSHIPRSVRGVSRRRLAALPTRVVDVLSGASILGRDFATAPLAALLDEGPPAVEAALGTAIDAHLVSRQDSSLSRYRFVHVLVQQTLEADLRADERARLHSRAVAVLPYTTVCDPGDLAHHALQALGLQPPTDTLELVVAAAVDADRRLAFEAAATWWREAIEVAASAAASPDRRAELEMALGLSLLHSGAMERARARFAQVANVARARGDGPVLARAALAIGDTVAEIAPDRELIALLDEALGRPDIDAGQRVRLLARRAIATYWIEDGPSLARERSAVAVQAARSHGDPEAVAAALIARHFTLRGPESLQERLAVGADALDIARRTRDANLEFRAYQWVITDQYQSGDVRAATASVDSAESIAHAHRDPMKRWWVVIWRTLLARFAGDLDATEKGALEVRELGRVLGQAAAHTYSVAQLVPVYRQRGQIGVLEGDLEKAIARYPGLRTLSCLRALLLADTGRREEAGALIDWISDNDFARLPRDSLALASWGVLGEATVVLRDPLRARPIARQLAPYADINLIQGAPVGWGSAAWHLARLAWLCDERDQARGCAEQATSLHDKWGAGGWGPPLEGLTIAQPSGGLSPREREVLALLAQGRSNKEIAASLYVSVHTVERHVANIFVKIGVGHRSEATAWAHRHRMVV